MHLLRIQFSFSLVFLTTSEELPINYFCCSCPIFSVLHSLVLFVFLRYVIYVLLVGWYSTYCY